jgi:two-component system chemotaxis response regulator CheB
MLSALTTDGADATVEALRLGAFDFVVKPTGQDAKANYQTLRSQLEAKIRAFGIAHCTRGVSPGRQAQPGRQTLADHAVAPEQRVRDRLRECGTDLMVIGVSTGGPPALNTVLPALPASCAVPILVVQHMPPRFTKSLAEDLDQRCALSVQEASHGQTIQAGQILIAPGGRQMKIISDAKTMQIVLTDDPPENHCRPSVDYLFRSAAEVCGRRTIAIMMTGMGSDGLQGCSALHSTGAFIMAQNEASCVVYGMPKAVVDHQLADVVVPLHEIARHMTSLSKAGVLA